MVWGNRIEVHIFNQPTDMRKSHDGLASLCEHVMGRNPLSGQVFVFMNKRRNRIKALYWDGTGICLLYKRLEQGKFTNIWHAEAPTTLSAMELQLMLSGARLEGKLPLAPEKMPVRGG